MTLYLDNEEGQLLYECVCKQLSSIKSYIKKREHENSFGDSVSTAKGLLTIEDKKEKLSGLEKLKSTLEEELW